MMVILYGFMILVFMAYVTEIVCFTDEDGPRRSTRADYETAIAAAGNSTYIMIVCEHVIYI